MQAFEEIFEAYKPIVFRFLLALCGDEGMAEELTCETFYRAYLHIGRFRGACKIETWLCQIAKHALQKEQKRQKRMQQIPDSAAAEHTLFDALAQREQALQIHKHLHLLKEPYREVFFLRVFGELRFQEIADVCGKSESWAKVTFYRAKNMLLAAMEGKQ